MVSFLNIGRPGWGPQASRGRKDLGGERKRRLGGGKKVDREKPKEPEKPHRRKESETLAQSRPPAQTDALR